MSKKASGKKRLTQREIFDHFAKRTGLPRAQVEELFSELQKLAVEQVKTRGEFILPGFGKLVRTERRAREGRNPQSGETIQIPAKTSLKFRPTRSMRELAGDPTKLGKP